MQNLTIAVIDNGAGTYIAEQMTKHFARVLYYSPLTSSFIDLLTDSVGTGIEGVQRISSPWYYINEIDVFYFTDLNWEGEAAYLRSIGKKVWGASKACFIEHDRELFLRELKKVGLQTPKYHKCIGITELSEYLKDKKDKFLKISYYRWTLSTKHWVSWDCNSFWLSKFAVSLGGKKEDVEILVFDPIECKLEIGYDGFSVNGKYPKNSIFGIEVKDACWCGSVMDYSKLPLPIQDVNNKFAPILAEYHNCGRWDTEIRYIDKDDYYFTDPVCDRTPEPPGAWMMAGCTNFGDVIMAAVEGEIEEPIYKSKYGAQLILKSGSCSDENFWIKIPPKYKDNVMVKGYYIKDGKNWIVPFEKLNMEMEEVAATVGFGDTIEEAIEEATEAAKSLEAEDSDLHFAEDSLDKALKGIESMKKEGFKF